MIGRSEEPTGDDIIINLKFQIVKPELRIDIIYPHTMDLVFSQFHNVAHMAHVRSVHFTNAESHANGERSLNRER